MAPITVALRCWIRGSRGSGWRPPAPPAAAPTRIAGCRSRRSSARPPPAARRCFRAPRRTACRRFGIGEQDRQRSGQRAGPKARESHDRPDQTVDAAQEVEDPPDPKRTEAPGLKFPRREKRERQRDQRAAEGARNAISTVSAIAQATAPWRQRWLFQKSDAIAAMFDCPARHGFPGQGQRSEVRRRTCRGTGSPG